MDESPRSRPAVAWTLMCAGAVLVLWAVLGLANAGYGTSPAREFAARRSYNMVKRDVHRAFPAAALRAACGLGLVFLGSRARRR